MDYTLTKPEGYQKVKVPDLNKWTAALRSGEYQQGPDYLCSINVDGEKKYCCLGVRLAIQDKLGFTPGSSLGFDTHCPDNNATAGFTDSNPDTKIFHSLGYFPMGVRAQYKDGDRVTLSALNDKGMPFSDIADIIDALYENE